VKSVKAIALFPPLRVGRIKIEAKANETAFLRNGGLFSSFRAVSCRLSGSLFGVYSFAALGSITLEKLDDEPGGSKGSEKTSGCWSKFHLSSLLSSTACHTNLLAPPRLLFCI
jgi:hypothetical protein